MSETNGMVPDNIPSDIKKEYKDGDIQILYGKEYRHVIHKKREEFSSEREWVSHMDAKVQEVARYYPHVLVKEDLVHYMGFDSHADIDPKFLEDYDGLPI